MTASPSAPVRALQRTCTLPRVFAGGTPRAWARVLSVILVATHVTGHTRSTFSAAEFAHVGPSPPGVVVNFTVGLPVADPTALLVRPPLL